MGNETQLLHADLVAMEAPAPGETPGPHTYWVRVTPWGEVKSRNGTFTVDEESGRLIAESFREHGTPLQVDYDHHSLGGEWAPPDGKAIASGWIHELRIEPGKGIFGRVEWTEAARQHIRAKEYQFLSPALLIRKADRKAIGIVSVGLVNRPAIPRMDALAAKESLERSHPMGNQNGGSDLGMLIAAMKAEGIQVQDGADAAALTTAFSDWRKKQQPIAEEAKAVRTLLALKAEATKDEVVLALSKIKSAAEANTSTLDELKKFKEAEEDRRAGELVQTFVKANKLNPNDKPAMEAALSLAKSNPNALHALMANTTPYATPGRTSDPGPAPGKENEDELIQKAMKEHKDNYGEAIASLQVSLKAPLLDMGYSSKKANEMCRERYPKIFGLAAA